MSQTWDSTRTGSGSVGKTFPAPHVDKTPTGVDVEWFVDFERENKEAKKVVRWAIGLVVVLILAVIFLVAMGCGSVHPEAIGGPAFRPTPKGELVPLHPPCPGGKCSSRPTTRPKDGYL